MNGTYGVSIRQNVTIYIIFCQFSFFCRLQYTELRIYYQTEIMVYGAKLFKYGSYF